MPRRVPPLTALKAFEAASRTGSFTLGARDLNVSQGAVSRHVMRLEEYLGTPLFDRRTREIALTAAGETFALDIAEAFALIEKATARVTSRRTRDDLRVTLFPSIARWVMPRLGRFQDACPDVDLTLSTSATSANLRRGDADVTNVRTPPELRNLDSIPLFDVQLQPVCAPGVARQLRDLEDLQQVPLLQSINRTDDWSDWLKAAGASLPRKPRIVRFDNSALMYQAAIDGLGVAMGHSAFLVDDFAARRLTAPFDLRVPTGETYHLAWLPASGGREGIQLFRDWIQAELSSALERVALRERKASARRKPVKRPPQAPRTR